MQADLCYFKASLVHIVPRQLGVGKGMFSVYLTNVLDLGPLKYLGQVY